MAEKLYNQTFLKKVGWGSTNIFAPDTTNAKASLIFLLPLSNTQKHTHTYRLATHTASPRFWQQTSPINHNFPSGNQPASQPVSVLLPSEILNPYCFPQCQHAAHLSGDQRHIKQREGDPAKLAHPPACFTWLQGR